MIATRTTLLAVAVVTLAAGTSRGTPLIRATVEEIKPPYPSYAPDARTYFFGDSFGVTLIEIYPKLDFAPKPTGDDYWKPWQRPVTGEGHVRITFDRETSGPPPPGSPSIDYSGTIEGHYGRRSTVYGGGWWFNPMKVELRNWTPESTIPKEFIDTFLRAKDYGQIYNINPGTLLIVPPLVAAAPVPEPSSWLAFGAVAAACLVHRARRRCR